MAIEGPHGNSEQLLGTVNEWKKESVGRPERQRGLPTYCKRQPGFENRHIVSYLSTMETQAGAMVDPFYFAGQHPS